MQEIVPVGMASIGQIANRYASQNIFADYQQRKAPNTLRRHKDDLAVFASYLGQIGVSIAAENLYSDPDTWNGVSYGLVAGFVQWMLRETYAIGSVNVRLSTIKTYCGLAARVGVIDMAELGLIRMVEGYRHVEGRNIDKAREITRKGPKKADPVSISKEQSDRLKHDQPDTPQGRRDALLMCLLLDHGLRCGEVAALKPEHIAGDRFVFYREKVDKDQTHRLTPDTLRALLLYLDACAPGECLLLGSEKSGAMNGVMSTRAITKRVNLLGGRVGLIGLSAHDCRHYWTTAAIKGGTDYKIIQDAGGWNSPAMLFRYAESQKIANQGIKLG